MQWESIETLVKNVRDGSTKAIELVNNSLARIKEVEDYNAVLDTATRRARERAERIDADVAAGKPVGKLAGIPFVAKDNFLTFGTKTTAGSKMLENYEAPYQATAIEKLESEGAIMVAKANMDAFACGTSGEHSDFGPTLNPVDKKRVPGGTSSGSATATALGVAPFALGSDTGGSMRQPSSFCGVLGLKPTYGRISRYGVISMASSLDVVAVATTKAQDASYILPILTGLDLKDSTTVPIGLDKNKSLVTKLSNLRVGVIREHMGGGLDQSVKDSILDQIKLLKEAGAQVEEVELPTLDDALGCYYIVMLAEVSSNLARYDGIRYGYSHPKASSLDDTYDLTRTAGFNDELKRRIIIGNYVLSSGYYDAYYKKAQLVRTKLINEFNEAFKKYDVLMGPTTPDVAFRIGENINDPLKMYMADVMTVGVSLAGLPAVSIPVGSAKGMPVGMQIIGKQKDDMKILSVAEEMESS